MGVDDAVGRKLDAAFEDCLAQQNDLMLSHGLSRADAKFLIDRMINFYMADRAERLGEIRALLGSARHLH